MRNTYLFKDNKILIEAPGNANMNRLKNDLIWDINNFLSAQYDLYTFYVCKSHTDLEYYFPIFGLSRKYVAFKKLDNMFTHRTVLSDEEIKLYREILDPSMKMNEDVFRESCCLENVDMEYVATEDINQLLCVDRGFNTTASFNRWIRYSVPVYISLFGAREMRIIVNQSSLLEQIQELVLMHCEKEFST